MCRVPELTWLVHPFSRPNKRRKCVLSSSWNKNPPSQGIRKAFASLIMLMGILCSALPLTLLSKDILSLSLDWIPVPVTTQSALNGRGRRCKKWPRVNSVSIFAFGALEGNGETAIKTPATRSRSRDVRREHLRSAHPWAVTIADGFMASKRHEKH